VKLLALVMTHAGEAMIRLSNDREGLFFTGAQPAQPSLITLELPGLTRVGIAIRQWLVEYHRRTSKSSAKSARRRERVDLVPKLWRKAVLDDFIDARNATEHVWNVSTYFTAAEIAAFCAEHGPKLHAEVREALAVPRASRPRALAKVGKRADRIVPVIYQGSNRVKLEGAALDVELDREDAAQLVTGTWSATKWIEATRKLRTDVVKAEVLEEIGKQLVAHRADIGAALDQMRRHKLDRVHAPSLWTRIAPHLVLEQTAHRVKLDLTTAREMTAVAGWELWTAKRIGPVKPGRAVLRQQVGDTVYYVRGERKLKHAIRARGGKITRWGCTLVVAGGTGTTGVHARLLEVDRIDTLAQVDPRGAVALVADHHPADPAIATALAKSAGDPRWRRVLADLLIERLVGIDADVARRMARAEAGANRR
jgi:hypothetical protein